jgi:hypothetical protein
VEEGVGFGRRACPDEQCHRPILADAREYDGLLAAFLARHACIRQHTSAYVSISQRMFENMTTCPPLFLHAMPAKVLAAASQGISSSLLRY